MNNSEEKVIRFYLYRYHLLPLESNTNQISLFNDESLSIEELKTRKNEFFNEILDSLDRNNLQKNPLRLEHSEENFFLFKLAQKKSATITKNFKKKNVETEPYVYVIFNNNPKVQKIAISENPEAFTNTTVVKNLLLKVFKRDLKQYGLNIEIEQLFDPVNFWQYVSKYKTELTYINFEFIKPNLANISKSLPEVFRKFAETTNSHESHVSIRAPKNGILENIDKTNEDINGLVEYTSEGAGSIKLKVKGIKKQYDTKKNPKTLKIGELLIEGATEQVVKVYKSIVDE